MVWMNTHDSTTVIIASSGRQPVGLVGGAQSGKDRNHARRGRGDGQRQDQRGAVVLFGEELAHVAVLVPRDHPGRERQIDEDGNVPGGQKLDHMARFVLQDVDDPPMQGDEQRNADCGRYDQLPVHMGDLRQLRCAWASSEALSRPWTSAVISR